ncbi:MAG: outer membrane protein assembly factor BamE [Limnobacter sp.]|nr:outer membrane protein assembly factor BamE [Limnobacter sp.]
MTHFLSRLCGLFRWGFLGLSLGALVACSMPRMSGVSDLFENTVSDVPPREFITEADLSRVRLGMSGAEVKKQIGSPTLGTKENNTRWDYVLRKGEGAAEEFLPHAIYFEGNNVVRIAALEPPAASTVAQGMAADSASTPEPQPEPGSGIAASAVAEPADAQQISNDPMPEQAAVVTGAAMPKIATPEPAKAASAPGDNAVSISDLLNDWAAAWSAKDVNRYLSFYAENFKNGKQSREAWEKQRKSRLSNKDYISVSLSDVQIDIQSDVLAEVHFTQQYASNRFKETGTKTLTLRKVSGQWKIQKEDFRKK